MKSDRRQFLQQLAAGSAWAALALGSKTLASLEQPEPTWPKLALPPPADDEVFWTELRNQFELTSQTYLNTGTLGLMPKPVMTTIAERMHGLCQGRYAIDDAPRFAVARLFNVDAKSIALTHNTTEGINIVAQGLRLKRGDEVILTDQEHVGNALPWLNRARLTGIKLKVLSPAATAAETMNRLNDLLTRRTRVIAVPHITCTTGHVLPIQAIAKLAHDKNIFSFIDGAHGPGMLFPDLTAIGCDFYASCGHKWLLGPAGTGTLYVKPEKIAAVEASMVGAYSDTGWELSQQAQTMAALVDTAHRFDYGTQNVALAQGLKSAIEFMDYIGYERVRNRVLALASYLQSALLNHSFVEMLTPVEASSRAAIIGFKLRDRKLHDIEQWAGANNFRLRLVQESHLDSIRVSCHVHNSYNDLDRLVQGLVQFMQI